MSRQQALIDLSARIADATPSVWGGSKVDQASGGRLIVWTTDQVATRAALETEPVNLSGLTDVRTVAHPFAELRATATKAQEILSSLGLGSDISAAIADPSLNAVRIQLPKLDDLGALHRDASSVLTVANSVASTLPNVRVAATGLASSQQSCNTYYELCDPPLRGGIEIQPHNTGGGGCTGGLVVRSSTDHKPYLLTASHCTSSVGTARIWYTGFSNEAIHDAGNTHNRTAVDWPYWDAAILNISNPSGWSLPTRSKVLVDSSGANRPTLFNEAYPITAVGDNCTGCSGHPIPQDSYLCWTGATYQTDCGRFDGTSGNQGWLNIDNYGSCQGDSGGLVYAASAGYGIIVRGANDTSIPVAGHRRYADQTLSALCTSYAYGADGLGYQGLGTSLRELNVELIP
jgi:hypothetical protein